MIRKIKNIFLVNFKSLVLFELVFKLASFFIFSPLFLEIFQLIMKITGFSYINYENILSFLSNPLTIIMIFILLLLISFYTLFDIASIILIIDASVENKKIKIQDIVIIALKKSLKVFNPKNMSILFLILFLIPFLNLGIAPSFISTISIPEYIMESVKSNIFYLIIFGIIFLILIIVFLNSFYSLHYFVLEDKNFKEACKCSKNLNQKNKIKDLGKILFTQIILFIIYFLFVALGVLLIFTIYHLFSKLMIINSVLISIIWLFIATSFFIYVILSTPISYACLSILFYKHKQEKGEKKYKISYNEQLEKVKKKHLEALKYILLICTIIGASIYTYGVITKRYNLDLFYMRDIKITAHRGFSKEYPENTMLAFIKAKEAGADIIELDVQQTSDNVLIVLHDKNLKRTTGLDKNTWEVTYEEVKELDAGSYLDSQFKNEHIPKLEEVIKWAKENYMRLNIELKPSGYEKDFEYSVIELLKKYDYIKNCVVTSQNYQVLEKLKEIDKEVETVYVMSFTYGNLLTFNKADHFSIETTYITKNMVKSLHNNGKEIYAWTLNSEENIKKMIDLNVDNIITDNPPLAESTIAKSKTSNVILEYIKYVENLFNWKKIKL